jgi:dCMP deaminase
MTAAYLFAQLSPDEQTKHGAILVDKHNRLLGQGFNGFPRGADDESIPKTRPEKYFFVIHAEDNCILNSRHIPEPELCTLYVTGPCCDECIKKILQVGIGRVVFDKTKSACVPLNDLHIEKRNLLLKNAKVSFVEFDNSNTKVKEMINLLDQTKEYILSR